MCGRARLDSDVREIKIRFSIPDDRPLPNYAPNWNVAPTQSLPIVRLDPEAGARSLDMMRWGLVPFWAKDIKIGYGTINAKAEGIEAKPAFREAFKRRRCLVPLDSFYEWKTIGKLKQPYAIALADRAIMAMAGLWDSWRSPEGETVRSFTIITTEPNTLMAEIHNRMPVILPPVDWPAWLGEDAIGLDALKAMLRPYAAEGMVMWPVDARVGNVRNNDPSLIDEIGLLGLT